MRFAIDHKKAFTSQMTQEQSPLSWHLIDIWLPQHLSQSLVTGDDQSFAAQKSSEPEDPHGAV